MLHVTNGDAAREAIRSTEVDGDVVVWRDVLHEGPVPAGASESELREIRATFLARSGWARREDALADLVRRDARVAAAVRGGEEVVLWFEDDLFDQLQLVQILDRLAAAVPPPKVTVVEVEGYLGLLSNRELIAAFARARLLGAPELALGRRAWNAFRAEDPRVLEELLATETSALPALAPALRRHLEQFPAPGHGLSRTELQALRALADGPLGFAELFERSQADEPRRFLGDVVFRLYLDRLAAAPAPLLERSADDTWQLVELGRAVLDGKADRLRLAPMDHWLGGVRLLSPHRLWRWDGEAGRLVAPGAGPSAD